MHPAVAACPQPALLSAGQNVLAAHSSALFLTITLSACHSCALPCLPAGHPARCCRWLQVGHPAQAGRRQGHRPQDQPAALCHHPGMCPAASAAVPCSGLSTHLSPLCTWSNHPLHSSNGKHLSLSLPANLPVPLPAPLQLVEEDESMKEMSAELTHIKQAANTQASLAAPRCCASATSVCLPGLTCEHCLVGLPACLIPSLLPAHPARPPHLPPPRRHPLCFAPSCCPACLPAAGCHQDHDWRGAGGAAPDQHRGGARCAQQGLRGQRQPPLLGDDGGVPCGGGRGLQGTRGRWGPRDVAEEGMRV